MAIGVLEVVVGDGGVALGGRERGGLLAWWVAGGVRGGGEAGIGGIVGW